MRIKRAAYAVAGTLTLFMPTLIAKSSPPQETHATKATPLILEKNEGERRSWRPLESDKGAQALPTSFILKVDPGNGGSSHLVFVTEDLEPGQKIDPHRHPGSDEILFLQTGTAEIHLADKVRTVHGGATVFIPAGTWISAHNTGGDVIHLVAVFSAPGFEDFMRAESVPEGEKVTPLSDAEDKAIQKRHAHAVIYQ